MLSENLYMQSFGAAIVGDRLTGLIYGFIAPVNSDDISACVLMLAFWMLFIFIVVLEPEIFVGVIGGIVVSTTYL